MNVQIGADEQALLAALLRPYLEGRELRVFGSRARATAKPWSDLDLLLIGAPLSLDERAALMEALLCFRRAGADLILSYYAKQAAAWLAEDSA